MKQPIPTQGLGQVNTGVSLDQREAIVIDITVKGVSIHVGEKKRIEAAMYRDLIVGGLNAYLKNLDMQCLQELKNMHEGV